MSRHCSSGVINRSTNESVMSSPDVEEAAYRGKVMLGVTVASCLLLVFGLVCNSLVFVIFNVFSRKRTYITISNRFVLNLSASNAIMSVTVLPAVLYSVLATNGAVFGGIGGFRGVGGTGGIGGGGVVGGFAGIERMREVGRTEGEEIGGGIGEISIGIERVEEVGGFSGVEGIAGIGEVEGVAVEGIAKVREVRGVGGGDIGELSGGDEETAEEGLRLGLGEQVGLEDRGGAEEGWSAEEEWAGPFGLAICHVSATITLTSISASIFAVLLISIDRFYAVSRPLHYAKHITSTKAWAMIAGSWLSSLAFAALPLIGWGRVRYRADQHLCLPDWAGRTWPDRSSAFAVVVVCFVVPVLIMTFVYVSVTCAARKTAAQARRNSSTSGMSDPLAVYPRLSVDAMTSASSHRNLVRRRSSAGSCIVPVFYKEDWKAAKTGFVVMTTFIVCWLPFFTNVFMDALAGCQNSIRHLGVIFVLLAVSGCIVNPLVYVFRTKSVRQQLLLACFSRGQSDAMVVLSNAADGRRFAQPTNYSIAISANARLNLGQSSTPLKNNPS